MTKRIHYLDHLRTFMVLLVVVIHSGLVYETALNGIWIVSDPMKNDNIGLVRLVLDVFVMFTLFFISGYFIPKSVQGKSTIEFVVSKFKRIMLPWFFGVLVLIPMYKMIFLYSRGMPQEEWYSYFHWFIRLNGNPYLFSDNPVQNWLWFLPVLFLFQMVYLGMIKSGIKMDVSFKRGVFLTVFFGTVYSMGISYLDMTGWHHSFFLHFQRERFLVYFLVFILGALAYKENVLDSVSQNKKQVIVVNLVLYSALSVYIVTVLNIFFNMITPGRDFYFVSKFWDKLALYISLVLSVLSFLHVWINLFQSKFNKTNVLLEIMNHNSYYVYVIHIIVIGLFALVLLNISLPVLIKYIVLIVLSFSGSHAIIFGAKKIIGYSR